MFDEKHLLFEILLHKPMSLVGIPGHSPFSGKAQSLSGTWKQKLFMCPMSFMLFTVLSFLHINLKLRRFLPEWRPSVDVQSCLVVRVEGTDYFREPEEESTFS